MAYPGGKAGSGVYQRIISLIPPHRIYIEPFLGAGAVFRLKRPAEINIGVEIDPDVLRGWKLPEAPAVLQTVANGAGRLMAIREGGARRRSRELAAVDLRWQLLCEDGIGFLRNGRFCGDELVYCDPPYMIETRSSGQRYRYEMTGGQHRELLGILKRLPCMVMISGYWSDLYARELADWRHIEFEAMTRGGMATEHLWLNFPPAVELHDYSYLGSNRREREQLKRQKARWVARLARMDELKRGALLSAIQEYSVVSSGVPRGSLEVAARDR